MELSPMRYKSYTWPHNPRVYSIDYERKMAVHKTPFGLFRLQDLGRTNRIMEGEGEFVGQGAYAQFGQLANVFYDGGPGLLVHPVWRTVSAYFVTLELMEEPLPDYVRYRFSFWEDSTASGGLVEVPVEGKPEGGTDPEIPAGGWGAVHTVRKGETLWGIAWRYGVALTALIAANPQIKNPNLIYPGDQVRIP